MRIVAGTFRGRHLLGPNTDTIRPTSDRVRGAIFNILAHANAGLSMGGTRVLDLFAGTGALGLEALSRGAVHATFIEKHVPTARVIEENIKALGVEGAATLLMTSAFLWGKRDATGAGIQDSALPWLVFCSPPYAFYIDRSEEMLELIRSVMDAAPPGSILVVESDERFDFGLLPSDSPWDVRTYAPAVVGVWRKP